jgi:hypothetical protein
MQSAKDTELIIICARLVHLVKRSDLRKSLTRGCVYKVPCNHWILTIRRLLYFEVFIIVKYQVIDIFQLDHAILE